MNSKDAVKELEKIEKKMLGSKWSFKEVMSISDKLDEIGKTIIHCYDRSKDDKTR